MSKVDLLKVAASRHGTAKLFGSLDLLEAKGQGKSQPERMVAACISDVLEERYQLSDAMDAIYMDDDYAGTYTDALRAAMRAENRCDQCGAHIADPHTTDCPGGDATDEG